ncbi:uncharacterized protein [Ranitomeya imitator]|uniref:uncharacterized protein n=1 Tax=Ranitomeya imitator TaxID=111125 RepID=UPI0037E98C23
MGLGYMFIYRISVFRQYTQFRIMDFSARELSWRQKASNIFRSNASQPMTDASNIERDMMKQYKNCIHKKTKIWWTKTTLENYVSQKIIPRGLRVQLYPTFDLGEQHLIDRWMTAASACSLEFLQIIIESNTASIKKIEDEISRLELLLKKDVKNDQLESFLKEIDNDLEKWEKDICAVKTKKYLRDVSDYDNNKIYRWQNPRSNDEKRKARSESFSSTSSTSDAGTSVQGNEATPWNKRTRFGGGSKHDEFFKKRTYQRNDKMKVINLSKHVLSEMQMSILEKGLTFCPSYSLDAFTSVKYVHLFSRKIILKKLHFKGQMDERFDTEEEREALANLEALERESNPVESFGSH